MTPRNLLFMAEGQLGDLLLLTPALHAARRSFPGAHIAVLVVDRRGHAPPGASPRHPVAGPMPQTFEHPLSTNADVDSLFVLNRPMLRALPPARRIRAELSIVRFLRSRHFDAVFCTFPEDRFAIYAAVSGAPLRVGQSDQPFRWLLSNTPSVRKDTSGVRAYYLALVSAIGGAEGDTRTRYRIPREAQRWARAELQRIGKGKSVVVMHPGATGDYKIWPPARFVAVAKRLERSRDIRVVFCHGPLDQAVMEAIREEAGGKLREIDTAGKLTRLAAVIAASDLCITNDSGPRHLAVAVGTPSLALFRQHHDREWQVYDEGPSCRTMRGKSACPLCPPGRCLDRTPEGQKYGSACLMMVSVDDVATTARTMLMSR
jgi:ADP-heptose:LPS heptosyltransferase